MSTNRIGPGTCNLSVNVPVAVRTALGRFAHLLDVSMGEVCRRLIAAGAHIARAFLLAERERREAELLKARLRAILADGIVTNEETIQLRDECLPLSESIARDSGEIAKQLKLAEAKAS